LLVDTTVVVAIPLLVPVVESVAVAEEEPVRVMLPLSLPVAVALAQEDLASLTQLWASDGRSEIHSSFVRYSFQTEGRAEGLLASSCCTEVGRADNSSLWTLVGMLTTAELASPVSAWGAAAARLAKAAARAMEYFILIEVVVWL